jgi:S-formylglutathione hydrolase
VDLIREHRCFGGRQQVYRHLSKATATVMEFSVYLPPQAERGSRPVVYYLSGLTCTWANVTEKGGLQRAAAEFGLVLVCPDTSPRGTDLPGEHDAYDFGSGAGFYVDATVAPWSQHYRMFSYVSEELPALVSAALPVDGKRQGVFGHSMGGHGALVLAFRLPTRYQALSALAPIVAPTAVPWGQKAFRGYLGADRAAWNVWDACWLAGRTEWRGPILVDQGTDDELRDVQLQPRRFEQACRQAGIPLTLRWQEGYDHSYYFIQSFMTDHLAHHARLLGAIG